MRKGQLYIIATPIGNLEDISFRALKILSQADIILAEDTRTTKKLLNKYEIKTRLESFNQHSSVNQQKRIISNLQSGQIIALVSEAGTPGVSDPGSKLVEEIRKADSDILITPIPGACALTTLISIAGIGTDKFTFLGFLPHKKGRNKALGVVKESLISVALYESKHRFLKLLQELHDINLGNRSIVVGRELTKLYETIYTDSVDNLLQYFQDNPQEVKGEFTIIIKKGRL